MQLHPTSLAAGRLGDDAYRFVDWLVEAGQSCWQMLPLGPPDRARSPYKSASAFAAWRGLLADPAAPVSDDEIEAFRAAESFWIGDWERVAGGRRAVADQVRFAREWSALRAYANERGVGLIGDVPIYVAPGGADHVAWPQLFRSGEVAGVPPDALSDSRPAVGQPACTTGRRCSAATTAGGPSACGARSRCSTSRGSTTSAASSPTGRCPRARRTRAAGAGGAGRGARCSTPPRGRWATAGHRRGSRRHHRAGRPPAPLARLPGHGRHAVRLRSRRPARAAPAGAPRGQQRRLHRHARHRHAARLVGGAGRADARGRGRSRSPPPASRSANGGGRSSASPTPRRRGWR